MNRVGGAPGLGSALWWPGWVGVIVRVVVAAVAAVLLVTARPSGSPLPSPVTDRAIGPASRFLATYVQPDGRISRVDEGGDTVSEGQAYGLLLALATDDEPAFARIWAWTAAHLQRPDGLLSWTWAGGAVTDASSAADADLDAAHALVAAGDHFGRPQWRAEGLRVASAILDQETVVTPRGRILTAGTWADTAPWDVNPSYGSPLAISYLSRAGSDRRWAELATGERAVLAALLEKAALPPDWAQVRADGEVAAMPSPKNAAGAGDVRFGLDAARVSVRTAASCSPADRRIAASLDRVLARPADQVRGVYDLGGGAVVAWPHPLQLVAAAASAGADGDRTEGQALLAAAAQLSRSTPTYYGTAWAALGQVLLQERSVLRPTGCDLDPALADRAAAAAATVAPVTAMAAPEGESIPGRRVRTAAVEPGLIPVRLRIPRLGMTSNLVKLGIAKDGTIEVPADFQKAGWLDAGPAPGQRGPAVLAGHVDSKSGPAIFARLDELRAGDGVDVERADGTTVTFTVDGAQRVAKDRFPTAAVYGPVPGPVLRLITCGGSFNHATGHYRDNVVVYASIH